MCVLAVAVSVGCAASAAAVEATDYFSEEEMALGQTYHRGLYLLSLANTLCTILFLGLVVFSSLHRSFFRDIERLTLRARWLTAPLYLVLLVLMLWCINAAFDAAAALGLGRAYGLLRQSVWEWLGDELIALGVSVVAALILLSVFRVLVRWLPRTWWLCGTAALGVMLAAFFTLRPIIIEPLFYRFEPILEGDLRNRIFALADRAGVRVRGLYAVNASAKSSAVNAYVTGLIGPKRVVFFDTLFDEAEASEVDFVVAHELAHWKRGDVAAGILWASCFALVALFVLHLVLRRAMRSPRLGLKALHDPKALPLILLVVVLFVFVAQPVACLVSRRIEAQADAEAVGLTGDPEGAIELFVKLGRVNLSDVLPPPWAYCLFYTHPAILERIEAASARPTVSESESGSLPIWDAGRQGR